jgi:hypothetical protein
MLEVSEAREDPGLANRGVTSLHLSFLFCTLIVFGFVAASEQTAHWFLVPILFCGVLIGCDAADWFRGRLSLFDPGGIIGLLGIHFFFLAPLFHVAWNSWMRYVEPPPDWREWLGTMAILNAVGLVLYRYARRGAALWERRTTTQATVWRLNRKLLLWGAGCGMILSGVLQIWVYAQQGGIIGYIETFTRAINDPEFSGFAGMGWIFMVSESFPILAMIYFAVCVGRSRTARAWLAIGLALFGFFVLQMFFGGLRGSRSNTVWALFWATGIIHFWICPLKRTFVFVGVCFLVGFMYLYGFYKDLGQDTLTAYQAGEIDPKASKTGRTLDGMLLGDLGRADVQAFLLYRLSMPDRDYQYAWGGTYLASATLLIPRAFWPERPSGKVKAGTEAQYGVGSYDEHKWSSSLVYGLAGETMLNFGPVAVPFAYGIFGLIVGALQRFMHRLRHGDTRLLLYPFLVNSCFSMLESDSDNLLFNFIKGGLVPILVVWFGSCVLMHSPIAESDFAQE